MDKLQKLINEARKSCKFRGHLMAPFSHTYRTCSHSMCKACGMSVWVITEPAPNEIDVGGPAVALHCPEREWFIYIWDEGDWPIQYIGSSEKEARAIYLKWAGQKRLPLRSMIWSRIKKGV